MGSLTDRGRQGLNACTMQRAVAESVVQMISIIKQTTARAHSALAVVCC